MCVGGGNPSALLQPRSQTSAGLAFLLCDKQTGICILCNAGFSKGVPEPQRMRQKGKYTCLIGLSVERPNCTMDRVLHVVISKNHTLYFTSMKKLELKGNRLLPSPS